MLRGTITLADRGAFLRAYDRLGLPLFTVLNARPAARAAVWEATRDPAPLGAGSCRETQRIRDLRSAVLRIRKRDDDASWGVD